MRLMIRSLATGLVLYTVSVYRTMVEPACVHRPGIACNVLTCGSLNRHEEEEEEQEGEKMVGLSRSSHSLSLPQFVA